MKKLCSFLIVSLLVMMTCSCSNLKKPSEENKQNETTDENMNNSSEESNQVDDIVESYSETSTKTETDNNDSVECKYMKLIKEMTDEEFLYHYVNDIPIGNFCFDNASEISSDDLFKFFLYSLFEDISNDYRQFEDIYFDEELNRHVIQGDGYGKLLDEHYEEYKKKWFDEETDMFVIPVEDITTQLDKYFKNYSFDAEHDTSYDEEKDAIKISLITGFGGCIFTKLVDKEINGNIVTVTVDYYYDENYKEIYNTKTFEFEFYDTGYYLLSVKGNEKMGYK